MAKTDGIWRQLDKGYIISTQVSIVQIPNTLELIEKSWKIKKTGWTKTAVLGTLTGT